MAINDIRIQDTGGAVLTTEKWQTESATTVIQPGDMVSVKAAGSKYAVPTADGAYVVGTTTANIIGIAKSQSTQGTAGIDGVVEVFRITPNTILRAKAKSAAAADTQAEIDALKGKRVVIDLTSGVYTVDTAAADAAANALTIVGGNPDGSFIDFRVRQVALDGPTA